MRAIRSINLSAAIIGLLCFFLPWVQVSCGGAKDTLNGIDLARNGHESLWLIPLLLLVAILVGLFKVWRAQPQVYAIVATLCGAISAILMNREQMRVENETGLIAAQLTGWFWLGIFSVIAVTVSGLIMFWAGGKKRVSSIT